MSKRFSRPPVSTAHTPLRNDLTILKQAVLFRSSLSKRLRVPELNPEIHSLEPQSATPRPGIESSPVCNPKETTPEFNTGKGVSSVAAVYALLHRYGHQVKIMPTSGEISPYDLLVDGKYRIEVKVCARRDDGQWFFNIHRHGVLDESCVDAYILRLEQVPEFTYALHLIIPAPIKRHTVAISLRSLITRYARFYNRFDFIGGPDKSAPKQLAEVTA